METKTKSIVITNYIQGLASFLDEMDIKWESESDQVVRIFYEDVEDLFKIGFEFGKFYESIEK